MQRMTQGRNARVAGRTLAAVSVSALAVSLVAVAGCASGVERGTTAKSADQNNEQSGYVRGFEGLAVKSRLERLIDREEEKPSVGSFALADRIMDGRLVRLTPGTAEFSDAVRPLDEVLALAVARIPAPAVRGEVAMLPQIAKGYVRARSAMLNDDAAGAVAIYEQIAWAWGCVHAAWGSRSGGRCVFASRGTWGSDDPGVGVWRDGIDQ